MATSANSPGDGAREGCPFSADNARLAHETSGDGGRAPRKPPITSFRAWWSRLGTFGCSDDPTALTPDGARSVPLFLLVAGAIRGIVARIVALAITLLAHISILAILGWALVDNTQVTLQAGMIGLTVFAALVAWLVAAVLAPVRRPFSDEIDRW